MRFHRAALWLSPILVFLVACSGGLADDPAPDTASENPAPENLPAEPLTVETLALAVACDGVSTAEAEPAVDIRQFRCVSLEGDGPELHFFDSPSSSGLENWLDSGGLGELDSLTVLVQDNIAIVLPEPNQELLALIEEARFIPSAPAFTPVVWAYVCENPTDEAQDDTYSSLPEVWAIGVAYENCDGEVVEGNLFSAADQQAVDIGSYGSVDSVRFLHGQCAETEGLRYTKSVFSIKNALTGENTGGQLDELEGMLSLCPDHPRQEELSATAAFSRAWFEEGWDDISFGPGLYKVGVDLPPGRYVTLGEKVTNCYWERQDSNGNTLDNFFTLEAFKVEVTIRDSDFAFLQDSCGGFGPVR
jgi:hypothetical protein